MPPASGDQGMMASSIFLAQRHQFVFDAAVEQVVGRLFADVASEMISLAGGERFHHHPGRVSGAADVEHLARVHQVVERAQRFVVGHRRRAVQLVQVNVVGLQTAQRVFTRFDDVIA